jgi:hypothetical protein
MRNGHVLVDHGVEVAKGMNPDRFHQAALDDESGVPPRIVPTHSVYRAMNGTPIASATNHYLTTRRLSVPRLLSPGNFAGLPLE